MKKNHMLVHVMLILGAVVMVVPFVWMILTSGKTLHESMMIPPTLWPKRFRWDNYSAVWAMLPFAKFYLNTLLLIVGRVFFSVATSAMAAYAAARLRFPGRNLFFSLVLIQMMIPSQIFITPQYMLAQKLGILDSTMGLILPGFVSAFGTFLLRQFFLKIPAELEESAVLDGASIWTIFFRIMLPLVRSGLIALGIFTALFAFKDLMWPLIATTSIEKTTLSAGLANLQGQYSTNYPQLMAGSLLAVWPMIVLFMIFQKKFIQGIATTGGKL
ncbi:carbohydrate ABC transporter permease [Lacticaseibacillus absianus]|uniref:carbohydrate ABC transporter permease n=1 Tax=Lacticaseibacillus absianus TaxID=2729623 RepID=UPI001C545221|nr:carbohydrate ABC transporter permease [Lacticaseibacillus absianus]